MKTEHGKSEETGQNSRSDRSSLGDKLKTEQTSKKASGEKLKNENHLGRTPVKSCDLIKRLPAQN